MDEFSSDYLCSMGATNLLQTNRKLLGRVLATRTGQSVTVIGKFALKSTKHNILNIIRIG